MSAGPAPARERGRGRYADIALIVVCLAWGATFVLVKEALGNISTLLFLTLRFSIAAAALFLVFARGGKRPGFRASIPGGVLAGVFLFGGYVLQTSGLRYTTAAKAGFITGLYIPLVPLLQGAFYRRAPQIPEALGAGAAFAGVALMTFDRDIAHVNRGDLLVAGCAVAYALHILTLGRFASRADAGWLAIVQIATAAALGAGSFWWAEPAWAVWSPTVWIALGVTSLLATAFAFFVQTWAQQYTSATRTAVIFSLEPVFAWITSYIVAGELLAMHAVAGALCIFAGILLVELKPVRTGAHQRLSDGPG